MIPTNFPNIVTKGDGHAMADEEKSFVIEIDGYEVEIISGEEDLIEALIWIVYEWT